MKHKVNKANNKMLRQINRKKVLSFINSFGPMPRVEICKKTGLSKPTVTRVIEQLIAEGYLVEKDYIESDKGRHPVNIEINELSHFCFGINLSKNTLGSALVDLKMNVIEKRLVSIDKIDDADTLVETIFNVIDEILECSKIDKSKLLGIGVGVPGLTDHSTGIVKNFALGGRLCGIPLKSRLEERYGYSVEIDNNCNTRMLGEHWYGYAVGCNNAMFVINSEGVGCGLVVDGRIYRKLNNTASGFGHLSVDMNGPKCSCGGKGCIETFCTTEAIERKIGEKLSSKFKNKDILTDIDENKLSYKELHQNIEKGDVEYASILIEAACAMAAGLVSMINLFRPEVIILSGNMFDASDFYYNMVKSEVETRLGYDVEIPRIYRRRVKDALYEVGAATMILQQTL